MFRIFHDYDFLSYQYSILFENVCIQYFKLLASMFFYPFFVFQQPPPQGLLKAWSFSWYFFSCILCRRSAGGAKASTMDVFKRTLNCVSVR